ncbi:hypothetical protein FH972_024117 [Carpinus fangiana]|uniref:Uncharacterized protein n=1 Tax=Carpinus fangiana TaxID=176857 RepID=A0A5N6KX35_9ROSI|nr:hypothetical protein FH972_024117 [Carpinus fangiana]
MAAVNIVKYFFHKEFTGEPELRRQLVALAYQTARSQQLHPKAIFIRSVVHDTTSNPLTGKHEKDPKGWHVTLCFKDQEQLDKKTHVTSHGYCKGQKDLEFVEATHDPEKSDSVRKRSGKPVWPDESKLSLHPDIGYSHLESLPG